MTLTFKIPSDKEFSEVCSLIKEYELDNRNLQKEEFTIALQNAQLVAFGRLRKHADCVELCSLGVLKTNRNKGIGTALINYMISHTTPPVYLVCIIPDFFSRFGFKLATNCPASIKDKINYCSCQLVVPETYVAMVLEN